MRPILASFEVTEMRTTNLEGSLKLVLSLGIICNFYYSLALRNYQNYQFYYRSKETTGSPSASYCQVRAAGLPKSKP